MPDQRSMPGNKPTWDSPTFESDVRRMFGAISGRYSLFDHVSTFGGDFIWRSRALWSVDRRLKNHPLDILDIGCGPGDLTFLLADHYPGSKVVGMDFTPEMVRRGEMKRRHRQDRHRVAFGVGDALSLPFKDSTIDLVTSAFLLRNLKDLKAGFVEMSRVLRPGGTMVALDITEPPPGPFNSLFHSYFDSVVPVLGAAFGNEGAYRYLSSSLSHVPRREKVIALMKEAGFSNASMNPQWLGIVTSFMGSAERVF